MRIRLVPGCLRTLATFTAPDPWNQDRPTTFNIEEYVMVPEGAVRVVDTGMTVHVFGLRSETDGADHVLPESLFELWRTGRIPPETLPRLLLAIQPKLKKSDYRAVLHDPWRPWTGPIAGLIIGLLPVCVYLFEPEVRASARLPGVLEACLSLGLVTGGASHLPFFLLRRRRSRQMQWALVQD